MDTPTTRRHRTTLSQERNHDVLFEYDEIIHRRRGPNLSDDESDLLCTQPNQQTDGVYWNFEPSPETRAQLQRDIAEADANSPSTGQKKKSPVRPVRFTKQILRPRQRDIKREEENRRKNEELQKSLIDLVAKVSKDEEDKQQLVADKHSVAKEDSTTCDSRLKSSLKHETKSTPKATDFDDNPFSSDEDNVLLQASQQCNPSPGPSKCRRKSLALKAVTSRKASSSSAEDLFEDEDDSFMANIDLENIATQKRETLTCTLGNPKTSSHMLKFNSVEVASPRVRPGQKSSTRWKSSPDVQLQAKTAGVPKPRCSQAEIERKRQEALMKRKRNMANKQSSVRN